MRFRCGFRPCKAAYPTLIELQGHYHRHPDHAAQVDREWQDGDGAKFADVDPEAPQPLDPEPRAVGEANEVLERMQKGREAAHARLKANPPKRYTAEELVRAEERRKAMQGVQQVSQTVQKQGMTESAQNRI